MTDIVEDARKATGRLELELTRIRQLRLDYEEAISILDVRGAVELLGPSRVSEKLGVARQTIYNLIAKQT